MATWRYGISPLVLKKYFTIVLTREIFSTLKEKFCISTQPCNILYFYSNDSVKKLIYLLPPSKQFETTTNQEILKAFVMSQGVLFSCVKVPSQIFKLFAAKSPFFSKQGLIIQSWVSSFLCHPYLELKQVDMKKSLAMKGYVPLVTATKLKMKIISYQIVRPILRLETFFSKIELKISNFISVLQDTLIAHLMISSDYLITCRLVLFISQSFESN